MKMKSSIMALCLALTALPAVAQTSVELIPPAPTSADIVQLRVIRPGITDDYYVEQHERHFIIHTIDGCQLSLCGPTGYPVVWLGMLSPGTYTYDIVPDANFSGSFVVANAGIPEAPTLSPAALIALCLFLVAAGSFLIGRRS